MKKTYLFLLLLFAIKEYTFAENTVPSAAHRAREAEYDLNFYFPDLHIEDNTTYIEGNVLMRARTLVPSLDTFAVELLYTYTIDSVQASLNGNTFATATTVRDSNEVNVLLPFTAHAQDVVQVRIYYHGVAPVYTYANNAAIYLGVNYCYTITEPYYAYTIFPCKQVLTDKADSSWFNITTSDSAVGISNGVLNNTVDLGNGEKRWEWRSHHAIAYYLVSFAVGHFELTTKYFHPEGRSDSMPVMFYDAPGAVDDYYYTIADNSLHTFSKLFGLYPFYDEKLSYVNINYGGGMENQTAISLTLSAAWILSHETAHQWFGDNVTCASFKDVMVNEGFADWCESIYNEFNGGGDAARIAYYNNIESTILNIVQCESGYDYGDTSSITGPFNINTDYSKNSMMINSLRFLVNNDSLFFLGLRNYQTQYHESNAYASNLRDAMENTTGIDLSAFFNQWYYGYGYPIFSCHWNKVNDTLVLRIFETTTCNSTPFFATPLEVDLRIGIEDTIVRLNIDSAVQDFAIPIGPIFGLDSLHFDPRQWLLNDVIGVFYDTSVHYTPPPPPVDTTHITGIVLAGYNNTYTIYPNPASNCIHIEGTGMTGVSIYAALYNTLGQQVYQQQTITGSNIYLPALANGIYILQLNNTDRIKVEIFK